MLRTLIEYAPFAIEVVILLIFVIKIMVILTSTKVNVLSMLVWLIQVSHLSLHVKFRLLLLQAIMYNFLKLSMTANHLVSTIKFGFHIPIIYH